jgi:hypothetical protein
MAQSNTIENASTMSQTIYARVPDAIKAAADAYAVSHGMTLASAVSDLLDRGLQAAADERSINELERRAAELSAEVEAFRERDQAVSSAYRALAQRTGQRVGECPRCGRPITGHDLLVTGHCPHQECHASLTSLLGSSAPAETAAQKGSLDEGEFKVLLGALGLLLGIAYLSQRGAGAIGGG